MLYIICINPEPFDREVIRLIITVHSFYDKWEYPTLTTILQVLREKEVFTDGRFHLWRVLKEIEFSNKKEVTKGTFTYNII